MFSIVREITGGGRGANCQRRFRQGLALRLLSDRLRKSTFRGSRGWLAMIRPSFISWIQSQASAIAWIMRGQEQGFAAFVHNILQQFKSALGVFGIEVAGRFVCQDHSRIVSQSAGDGHALLFAAGEMAARPAQFVAQANGFQQLGGAFAHLPSDKLPKLAHRDHHIFLRREILHQEMELKNEADEFASLMRQLIIAQVRNRLRFD